MIMDLSSTRYPQSHYKNTQMPEMVIANSDIGPWGITRLVQNRPNRRIEYLLCYLSDCKLAIFCFIAYKILVAMVTTFENT